VTCVSADAESVCSLLEGFIVWEGDDSGGEPRHVGLQHILHGKLVAPAHELVLSASSSGNTRADLAALDNLGVNYAWNEKRIRRRHVDGGVAATLVLNISSPAIAASEDSDHV
jgi:hypothetical protein